MKREAHSYSCLMAMIPKPLADKVKELAYRIPPDKIYDDEKGEKGIAKEVHVTVKYGIHTKDVVEVLKLVEHCKPLKVRLGKTSVFWNDESIVLKIGVQSLDLVRLNSKVRRKLECTDTFPDYKPHVTVAYVKKDEKNPYWFNEFVTDEFDGVEVEIDKLVFSSSDGQKYEILLGDGKLSDRISKIASRVIGYGKNSRRARYNYAVQ